MSSLIIFLLVCGFEELLYCHVYGLLKMGFELVIGFINHFKVVTAINYYTIAALQSLQSLHTNLFGLFALVFTY
jgi:hypothetical protein